MSTPPPIVYDTPIIGSGGNQLLRVESSITFEWVPAAGNAYVGSQSWLNYTDAGMSWQTSNTTAPSSAIGSVKFEGVSSSEPFTGIPAAVSFNFSNNFRVSIPSWEFGNTYNPGWTFDPTTSVLDPQGSLISGNDWVGAGFQATETDLTSAHWDLNISDKETGHWQLVPDIHNVDVFGGSGNDTILGGQGTENLYGGDGNDLIRAGTGTDLLYGGNGNDELHGGTGRQTLMGGAGDDTIWGGSSMQLLMGGDGQDMIHAGSGSQTLMGGAGNDTLWGGTGDQSLQGGDGNDVINAGAGNETLSGGSGSDTFVFSTVSGHDVITDFTAGQDIIEIAPGTTGPKLVHPLDLLPFLSADAAGDALLTVGSGLRLVLQHVPALQVQANPAEIFKLA